ncbi:hypothetical protein AXF42_Ash013090 [Apostasia shenzhenica]|uniref:Uncharacterized protein n=1 Tax=Apostasia shenzhenica TaxID=1088818 RepID=A0A2I0BD46_9ASPA|nr:hypothetical protein AXF42_Ash013090 [Apostasia shenzhenica]
MKKPLPMMLLSNLFKDNHGHLKSLMAKHEVFNATCAFHLNPKIKVCAMRDEGKSNTSLVGFVCIYIFLDVGIVLLPQTKFKGILKKFKLVPAQLSPNGLAYIYGLCWVLKENDKVWDLSLFKVMFIFLEYIQYHCYLNLRARTWDALFSSVPSSHSN